MLNKQHTTLDDFKLDKSFQNTSKRLNFDNYYLLKLHNISKSTNLNK